MELKTIERQENDIIITDKIVVDDIVSAATDVCPTAELYKVLHNGNVLC